MAAVTTRDQALARIDGAGVRAGQRWTHHKGTTYTVIAVGLEESTVTPAVVYAGPDGVVWVRRLTSWLEDTAVNVSRFSLVVEPGVDTAPVSKRGARFL